MSFQTKSSSRQIDGFFAASGLPVFSYLSSPTLWVLTAYLQGGNSALREKKLIEFFKCVDWMAWEDLQKSGILPLEQLARWDAEGPGRLCAEIGAYLRDKDQKKREASKNRQEYRMKVIEYFRQNVPAEDKMLLESLRDYELDLTGRDTNWRHHFTLDSIRRIDAFVGAAHSERQARIEQFRQDVLTYKKNYEKLKHQAQCGGPAYSFDDWCEQLGEQEEGAFSTGGAHQRQRQARQKSSVSPVTPLERAYHALELPVGTAMGDVKKQFRRLTLCYHPDVRGGSSERMKGILSAYEEIRRHLKHFG